jgi:monomeric sarcosine oxidase
MVTRSTRYDLIVLGTGGIGSAALYHAANRGLNCLGLDRFPPAHDRGSSHGESRLIRLSYFEHPDYVPLLRRSYQLWDELDPNLLKRCGVLYTGRAGGAIIRGLLASAHKHRLNVEEVAAADIPQYTLPRGATALFEADAGWLPVERCVQLYLDRAMAAGAEHRWGEAVIAWQQDGDGVSVDTDAGRFSAGALVIAGGAWNGDLLPDLALPLTVVRKHLHWFRCDDDRYRSGFFFELPQGQFYGFPARDGRLKLAEHSGGEVIEDPLNASREPDPQDDQRIAGFVAEHLPGVQAERLEHGTCFYTRTPDEHFVVDTYPGCNQVAYAAGLSGHGFKFAPVLGELLVDLAVEGKTTWDIGFLTRARFAG